MALRSVITAVLMLASGLLYFAPEGVSTRIHASTADLFRPGQEIARQVSLGLADALAATQTRAEKSRRRELERMRGQLAEERQRNAALKLQLVEAAEQQARQARLPSAIRSLPPLTSPALVPARILGDVLAERWRHGKLLDRGTAEGIQESDLVLKSADPLVDLGQDASLSPEDALLLGRCVIGKVERVGKWTSTVLMLTDARYRGRAQLVHEVQGGYVYGARGILEGQGTETCRLTGISSAEAVAVGDAVYTMPQEGTPTPLYYGEVIEARLLESGTEWLVLVRPAPLPTHLDEVQILRSTVREDRLSAAL